MYIHIDEYVHVYMYEYAYLYIHICKYMHTFKKKLCKRAYTYTYTYTYRLKYLGESCMTLHFMLHPRGGVLIEVHTFALGEPRAAWVAESGVVVNRESGRGE